MDFIETDNMWVDLNKVARERKDLDDRERILIERARSRDWSWREIAEALELEGSAQARYRELSDRLVESPEPAEER